MHCRIGSGVVSNWRDMLAPANANNEARGSILDSLKTLNQAVSNTGQQWVAVVEPWKNKCPDYCLPCIYQQRSNDRADWRIQLYVDWHTVRTCADMVSWLSNTTPRSRAVSTVVVDDCRIGMTPCHLVGVELRRRGNPKTWSVHYWQRLDVTVECKNQTYLKCAFKISSKRSNASLKTCTSLPDCFIDDQLITWLKCSHSSIKRDFSWATSSIRLRYTRSCTNPEFGSILSWGQDCWLAR